MNQLSDLLQDITTGFTKSEAYAELKRNIAEETNSGAQDTKAILEG